MNSPDLSTQRKITYILLIEYGVLIVAFLGGMVVLVAWAMQAVSDNSAFAEIPDWVAVLIAWIQGSVGNQIGTLTGAVKDALQFWLGSSFGSKTKDKPQASI